MSRFYGSRCTTGNVMNSIRRRCSVSAILLHGVYTNVTTCLFMQFNSMWAFSDLITDYFILTLKICLLV